MEWHGIAWHGSHDTQSMAQGLLGCGSDSCLPGAGKPHAVAVPSPGQSRGSLPCCPGHTLCDALQGLFGLLGHQGIRLSARWPPAPPGASLQSSFPAAQPYTCAQSRSHGCCAGDECGYPSLLPLRSAGKTLQRLFGEKANYAG